MLTNYDKCLAKVLRYEGGYSNHPSDPGGATMKGVTQGTYNGYRKRKGLPARSVRFLEQRELAEIYKSGYWDVVGGSALASGLDLVTFDAAVNSGPSRALRWLKAGRRYSTAETIKASCAARLSFMQALKTWSVFGKGWRSRVADVEATALRMCSSPAEVHQEAKAASKSASRTKQAGAATVGTTVAGAPSLPHDVPAGLILVIVVAVVILGVYLWFKSSVQDSRVEALLKDTDAS